LPLRPVCVAFGKARKKPASPVVEPELKKMPLGPSSVWRMPWSWPCEST
jgi:hypothetical protein